MHSLTMYVETTWKKVLPESRLGFVALCKDPFGLDKTSLGALRLKNLVTYDQTIGKKRTKCSARPCVTV